MIEINLLPDELRKKESVLSKVDVAAVVLKNVDLAKFAVITCVVLAAAHGILFGIGLYGKARLSFVSKEQGLLGGMVKEAMELKAKADVMSKKKASIDQLMVRSFGWAKKLNDLSDSMTAGIWLSELSCEENGADGSGGHGGAASGAKKAREEGGRSIESLVLSGYASSDVEEGTASIGRFIKSLKDNAGFYGDFSDIELGSIKRGRIDDRDVMNFRIICLFKDVK